MRLLSVVSAGGWKASLCVLVDWFKTSIAPCSQQYTSEVLSELLRVAVPALRGSETQLRGSGLSELAQRKLAEACSLPPVAALLDQTNSSDQRQQCIQVLDVICSCFPCGHTSTRTVDPGRAAPAAAGVSTAAERQALLAAAAKQMQGERSLALAAAAANRAGDNQASTSAAACPHSG